MFQDEARFGRMVRIRRCWSPAPQRPVVDNGYEREFQYVYGAVSPLEGELDWSICSSMNTEQMGRFLAQVSAACVFRRIRTVIPIHIGQVFRSFVGHFSERSDAVGRFIRGGSLSVKA
jgi:hypothetical protein